MALTTSTTLNVMEKRELKKLEKQIDDNLKAFLIVGNALLKIRDSKLYRGTHKTAEAYMQERFGIDRSYAYRLMSACEVRQDLLPIGDKMPANESHLREIAKAPREHRQSVVESVFEQCEEEDREPTAKDFKHAVAELTAANGSEPADTPVTAPSALEEAGGYEPEELAEQAIENGHYVSEIVNDLRSAKRKLKDLPEVPGCELMHARRNEVLRQMESLISEVATRKPHSVCSHCRGERCPQCGNMGWVNSVAAKFPWRPSGSR